MKTRFINGQYKMKSNFDFSDDILLSPNHKLSHIDQLTVKAELTGDSEIIINAVIPFEGKLIITRSGEKNALPLVSLEVNKGYFMTTIPVSIHDETEELQCILSFGNKIQKIVVELMHAEMHI